MLQIDDKIVSFSVLEETFTCDLSKCKGACCIIGDSGAPLEDKEVKILKTIYPKIKKYLRKEAIVAIEKQGTSVIDTDGDLVTPLIDNKECVYIIFDDGIAKCAIEKAYNEKKIKFKKPISCHLYPIRIKQLKDFEGLNYDRNEICKPARELGKKTELEIYTFLKEPLIRKYGKKWYKELCIAANELAKNR